jgi:hypothetical protein
MLPAGVRIQDLGPKMGLNGVDNGQVNTACSLSSTFKLACAATASLMSVAWCF